MSLVLVVARGNEGRQQRLMSLLSAAYSPMLFNDSEELLQAARESRPSAVIIGSNSPSIEDLELIEEIQHHCPSLPILVVPEELSRGMAFRCARAGATHLFAEFDALEELPRFLAGAIKELQGKAAAAQPPGPEPTNGRLIPHPIKPLREVVQQHIASTLSACRGNRSKSAKLLGIDRSTLRRRMSEFQSPGQPDC